MPQAQPLTIDFAQPDALKQILPRLPILSSLEAGWEAIHFAYYRWKTGLTSHLMLPFPP